MKNKNDILGTVKLDPSGIDLVVTNQGGASDYCEMRAAQLSALTTIVCGDGYETFKRYNEEIQSDVLFLINGLAQEIQQLIPIVCLEEEKRTVAKFNRDKGVQHE
nr:hypothetical protein [uncultured Undibacterium sp.]